ncbi:helix-turn-helix transcriptional regulator [Micromonospora deserti]|uniref:AraC family transcriptional regulator n=1 Tax=Micromonospora deserti TaxID=2070366 RepID=A0A2W2DCC9_9ACTN|nr:helix-turn-helix transcriptional regulator [Micromonospora deserti]PZF94746.1 AraC family transcriptional regulator [Micromonospora deserti]
MITPKPDTHRFEACDPEVIHHFLVTSYGVNMRIRGGEGGYRFRHHRRDAGPFRLDSTEQSTSLEFDVEGMDELVICQATTARVAGGCDGVDERFGPGEVFLAAKPGLPYGGRWHPGRLEVCLLDPAVLAQVASTAPARRPGPVRFTALRAASPVLARHWRGTVRFIDDVVLSNPQAAAHPLVIGNAARMLAAAALAVFPNTAVTEPAVEDRADAGTSTLRRALAFMHEHADRDISAVDIAAAANVSVRAVQLAFRRHLDTTPMAHLRRIRLDRAHHDLLRADPRQDTVSAIASRWGFLSHSRFTAHYHAVYGVPPSETLHA